jgi:type 1 glutamine amidotransferase
MKNLRSLFLVVALTFSALSALAADKKIVLIAGRASHGPGEHEHRAGCLLLQKCLANTPGIKVVVFTNGWPSKMEDGKTVDDHAALDDAAAIIIYSDGEGGHPAIVRDHLDVLSKLVKKGVGLGCLHYAVEPLTNKGHHELIEWIGGAFESNWSVNPHWQADFKQIPTHAVTRGVKPFSTSDEWYFNIRFRPEMKGVVPLLTAVPTDDTMKRKDGPHEGNPAARAAVAAHQPQHMMWAVEREDGGRGFGFTGGHFHTGWKNDDQRKLVLNAILWAAKVEVPKDGVVSTVTDADLTENLDVKRARGPAPAPASAPVPTPATAPKS